MSKLAVFLGDDVYGFKPGEIIAITCYRDHIQRLERLTPADIPALEQMHHDLLLDLRGKLVLPGLIDAHLHAIATGMLMLGTDLHDVTSVDELAEAVRQAAAQDTEFVRLGGLDDSRLSAADRQRITRTWLDELVPDRPLAIKSVEGHSGWFNTPAWKRVGIRPVLEGLSLERALIDAMWESGRVHGNAYEHITTPLYDSYTFEERRKALALAIAAAQRAGLTGLHCMEGYGEHRRHDFKLILELDHCEDIDLTLYCRNETPALAHELEVPRFGGCWCVDGAIGARSAAISEPYTDQPDHCGELYYSAEQLKAWIEPALKLDMQVCLHTIGDRAIDLALSVYEQLKDRYDLRQLRPRLDHFIMGTAEQARRAAKLGIVSAMQPAFDARWGGTKGGYAQRLGAKRALNTNPVGEMIRAGLLVGGSSDSYITPLDPLSGIRAAMNHHNPMHQVDFDTAVRLFSEDAAYLAHQELSRGRIAEEYLADFTVVDGDRELNADARVTLTIKQGKVVYDAQQSSA